MKYLSIDLESTGLKENCHIIEFAMIPFDTEKGVADDLARTYYVQCPSFEELTPILDPWVRDHMKEVIVKAHAQGIPLAQLKAQITSYLESPEVTQYFEGQKIVLFGKSMNAIDLPFLNRDLGFEYMRKYFSHRTCDLSAIVYAFIDLGLLPPETVSGSELMRFLGMGEVKHTALEDARNTALMYLKMVSLFRRS